MIMLRDVSSLCVLHQKDGARGMQFKWNDSCNKFIDFDTNIIPGSVIGRLFIQVHPDEALVWQQREKRRK